MNIKTVYLKRFHSVKKKKELVVVWIKPHERIRALAGEINKYLIGYDKRLNTIYIPEPIKSEAKIKNRNQFWLPKGGKYSVMFYTIKDTSTLLYTKKGIDYIYRDTIPIDYNMFIVDTRQDNSEIVKEFMRILAFNTSMKYPGKLENRKDIQEMMVKSGCYEYDNNGKLKLVINPLELVKENKR